MLLQSHMGEIHLLPALPAVWKSGSVKGLVARGAHVVDLQWADGKLTRCRIQSRKGSNIVLRYGKQTRQLSLKAGQTKELDGWPD
jgi:alpha-L-fucosidase 2